MAFDDLHEHMAELFSDSRLELLSRRVAEQRGINSGYSIVGRPTVSAAIVDCGHCGVAFERPHQRGQPRRYCTPKCQQAAARARAGHKPRVFKRDLPIFERGIMKTRRCASCSAAFEVPHRRGYARRKYCSVPCERRAKKIRYMSRPLKPLVQATCARCQQPFSYERRGRPRRYCSTSCFVKARDRRNRLPATRACEWCSKPAHNRFCSRSCYQMHWAKGNRAPATNSCKRCGAPCSNVYCSRNCSDAGRSIYSGRATPLLPWHVKPSEDVCAQSTG